MVCSLIIGCVLILRRKGLHIREMEGSIASNPTSCLLQDNAFWLIFRTCSALCFGFEFGLTASGIQHTDNLSKK